MDLIDEIAVMDRQRNRMDRQNALIRMLATRKLGHWLLAHRGISLWLTLNVGAKSILLILLLLLPFARSSTESSAGSSASWWVNRVKCLPSGSWGIARDKAVPKFGQAWVQSSFLDFPLISSDLLNLVLVSPPILFRLPLSFSNWIESIWSSNECRLARALDLQPSTYRLARDRMNVLKPLSRA